MKRRVAGARSAGRRGVDAGAEGGLGSTREVPNISSRWARGPREPASCLREPASCPAGGASPKSTGSKGAEAEANRRDRWDRVTEVRSLARSLESSASALAGALAGGVAAGYAAGWVSERTSRDTRGIEDIAEGFADLGGIIFFGFLGASVGCYVLLRLRRHAAAGPTAFTLLLLTVASPFLVLLPGSEPLLWPVFLLGAPLLARAIGVRVPHHHRQHEPR